MRRIGAPNQCPEIVNTYTDGFTLLEVLVALAIMGMSLTVLLAIFSQCLKRTYDDGQRLAVHAVAQSLLSQMAVSPPDMIKTASGQTSQKVYWRVVVSDYGSEAERAAWGMRPVEIDMKVCAKKDTKPCLSTRMLRLLPKDNPS